MFLTSRGWGRVKPRAYPDVFNTSRGCGVVK